MILSGSVIDYSKNKCQKKQNVDFYVGGDAPRRPRSVHYLGVTLNADERIKAQVKYRFQEEDTLWSVLKKQLNENRYL